MTDVAGWEMTIGRITAVEEFPEARRPAYKIAVDFGSHGAMWTSAQVTTYPRGELLGRLVVGVTNLPPKRIAGFSSECLLLGADSSSGVRLLAPDDGAAPGDRVF